MGENKSTILSDYESGQKARDETESVKSSESGMFVNLAAFKRLMINDLCKPNLIDSDSRSYAGFSVERIDWALENPSQGYPVLLKLSEYLMRTSPHYQRLNMLYSNMAMFNWCVDITDINIKSEPPAEAMRTTYLKLVSQLEKMELKHEFQKIMAILPYQDIFCGLVIETNHDFFIQKIDFNICKLYQVQDGLFNFAIDLSKIRPGNIGAYPNYIQKEYYDYINGDDYKKGLSSWYIPDVDKQICIKLNQQYNYPFPLLIGLIKDIFDLKVYKGLKLQSARLDNFKAIGAKVPLDESSVNKPLITPEYLSTFAEISNASLNEDIGLIFSIGSDPQPISFKDSSNTRNNVSDAIDSIYDSSGVSKELFNGSSSGTAVTFSLENDSGIVYSLYRQFERWANRYIKAKKYNRQTYKFKFVLLDITIFNKDKEISRYKDAATLGLQTIDRYLASLGITPGRILGTNFVHTRIFDFANNLIPLQSSYNSSADAEAGRPTNESAGQDLSESGEKTKDGDGNIDR